MAFVDHDLELEAANEFLPATQDLKQDKPVR